MRQIFVEGNQKNFGMKGLTMEFAEFINGDNLVGVATLLVAFVTFLTLIFKVIWEYTRQGAQIRTENFILMRRRYEEFQDLCALLETMVRTKLSGNIAIIDEIFVFG